MTQVPQENVCETSQSALTFLQGWLDHMMVAFFDNDFEAHARDVHLPLTFKTDGNAMIVRDADALREGFDAWVNMMKTHNVTRIIRTPTQAAWIGEDRVSGIYESQFLSDDTRVLPIMTSLADLVKVDGTWKITTLVNGMKNISWPIRAPLLVPDKDGKA